VREAVVAKGGSFNSSSLAPNMGDGFRGVSSDQDGRFKSQEKKLFAKMKFPSQFATKVDMRKVRVFICVRLRGENRSAVG
jgi:hypothetical protein